MNSTRRLIDADSPTSVSSSLSPRLDFTAIARLHGRALYARALVLTRNHSDACDLFQDTIERALRAKRQGVKDGSALPWLVTIMRNAFVDGCRRQKARQIAPDSIDLLGSLPDDGQARPASWRYIDDESLTTAIGELPSSAASMFRMFLDGTRYAEIGARFDIPSGTVGTRLHRIRRQLRQRLCSAVEGLADDGGPDRPGLLGDKGLSA